MPHITALRILRATLRTLAALACLQVTPAGAHQVWITRADAGKEAVAHVVFGDLDNLELAHRDKIVACDLVSAVGKVDLSASLVAGTAGSAKQLITMPFAAPRGAVVAIAYDNGFWIRQAKGKPWLNSSKLALPDGTGANWSMKWGKALLGPGSHVLILRTRLEIVALQDPYAIAPGGKLPVRVELEGKPLANAAIAYTDGLAVLKEGEQPTQITDANGIAEIPLDRKGPYLLAVEFEAKPVSSQLADTDDLFATLTFDTRHP